MAASSVNRSDDPIAQTGPSRAFLTSLHPRGDVAGDVVVLALTAKQCRGKAERERLIDHAVSSLGHDGIIWVNVPGRWRATMMSALRGRGMAIGTPSVRRPRGAGSVEIALTARTLGFALERGHLSGQWRSVRAVLQWIPFGRVLLTRLLPGLGFAAFRPGTRPFAWLVNRLDDDQDADIVLLTNWRGERAPYLVFVLGPDQALVAKRGGAESGAQIGHEAAMLKLLGPDLAACGLAVPRLIDSDATMTLSTLIESNVTGRPMASLIREGLCRDLSAIVGRLSEWLACWNRQTLRHVELTPELADRLIISPVRVLIPSMERGSAYLEWLSNEAWRLVGSNVPLVAAHNDLTMANVLGNTTGVCSIVDWEAASPDGLPLTDLRYAVCDAAATITGEDRLSAFRACFLEGGEHRNLLQRCEAPLRELAGAPPRWLELCVHAGWLCHAANEQSRSSSSRVDGSFVAIANLLAEQALSPARDPSDNGLQL